MKYSTAITLPINSPSASVALTQEQCWNALVHKARDPQPFMPIAILDFAITDDRGADGLTRHVRVTDGRGVVQGDYDEIIEYYKPARMGFHLPDQKLNVINLISSPPGAEHDPYLTIAYVIDWPDLVEGSLEARRKIANLRAVGRRAIELTLLMMRRLASEGKL